MSDKQNKKFTFITRHYPPNPNINGESVWDLVKYLEENHSIESNVVCIDRTSQGGGASRAEIGNIIRIKPASTKENFFGRLLNFLTDGYRLTKRAKKIKNSIIVCNTSPPLLPLWGSLLLHNKYVWSVWFFDLFPEFLYANKTVKKSSLLYKWAYKNTYKHKPNFIITLGPKQAKHLQQKYKSEIQSYTLPCGVFFYQNKSEQKPNWYSDEKITLGYCGNIGMAHNPEFIKAVVGNLDSAKYQIILALYGDHAQELKKFANNKAGVVIVDRVPRDQLHFIDIHLVTLKKGWTHIAVPSKAVSAVSLGATIMFCGDKNSDNWFLLQKAGWYIDEDKNIEIQAKSLLQQITKNDIIEKRNFANQINDELKNNINNTYRMLAEKIKNA